MDKSDRLYNLDEILRGMDYASSHSYYAKDADHAVNLKSSILSGPELKAVKAHNELVEAKNHPFDDSTGEPLIVPWCPLCCKSRGQWAYEWSKL